MKNPIISRLEKKNATLLEQNTRLAKAVAEYQSKEAEQDKAFAEKEQRLQETIEKFEALEAQKNAELIAAKRIKAEAERYKKELLVYLNELKDINKEIKKATKKK